MGAATTLLIIHRFLSHQPVMWPVPVCLRSQSGASLVIYRRRRLGIYSLREWLCNPNSPTLQFWKGGCKIISAYTHSTLASRFGAVAPGDRKGSERKTGYTAASKLKRGDRANLLRNADLSFPSGYPCDRWRALSRTWSRQQWLRTYLLTGSSQ